MNASAASLEMIRRLIGFPTVSRESNLDLIDFVREHLRPYDADIRLTFDDDKRKANLFATLGPRREGGIVLSGHTDVVPVKGQAWDTDPFTLVDHSLYGEITSITTSVVPLPGALSLFVSGLFLPFFIFNLWRKQYGHPA